MLLQQLKLENIRSYINETIDFPSGSTVLAGDIGTGKSSILLAIEFALFGTSRPDLPAEALLRKGTAQGGVELKFRLEGKEIIIKRNLKKDKLGIKQLAGHLLVNGIKKELMPIELKTEIVNMLGYPEDYTGKNKNYIFRYTTYTPQEEMKLILQDDIETRLDVLRKIFNIDKYKTIRENLQFYLRLMRTKIAILNTKLEPFAEQKEKYERLLKEKNELALLLGQLKPLAAEKKTLLLKQKELLEKLEKEQQLYLQLKQQNITTLDLIEEKKRQLAELIKALEILPEQVEGLSEKIKIIEEQKSAIITKKNTCQQKIRYLQQLINNAQQEINRNKEAVLKIEEKERLKIELEEQIKSKEELKQKQLQLEQQLNNLLEVVSKNEILLLQSEELKAQIQGLAHCPTCLQEVPAEHRNKIIEQEEGKAQMAGELLRVSRQKKSEIIEQKTNVQQKIEELLGKEHLFTKIRLELIQLQEKKAELGKKQEQLIFWVKENNELMTELAELEKIDVEKLNKELTVYKKILDDFSKKQYLEKNITELEKMRQGIILQLEGKADLTKNITEQKEGLNRMNEEEKQLSLQQMRLSTQLENLSRQEEELKLVLAALTEQKKQQVRLKELHHWLDNHFLQLTYTIEKQVMLNIHHLFNQLFQEWFSILIDDEQVYSRLDDSFTPIIEQNGYEISFSNLSGGERTSAALAYRLALNRVINDVISAIKTKDLLILDEPTDGFSSEQLDKVRDVLERLQLKQTIIVSHENKIESFVENVIRVGKQGQVSGVS